MKKLLAILLALVFVFSFAACSEKEDAKDGTTVAGESADASTDKKEESDTPLGAVLDLYVDAMADSSVMEKDEYAYLAAVTGFASGVDYAYADINGDGTDELLVGMNGGSYENGVDGRVLFNVWKEVDGVVEPLFEDMAFGYGSYLIPCEDGKAMINLSPSGMDEVYNLYDATDLSAEPELVSAVCAVYNYTEGEYHYYSFDYFIDDFDEDGDYTEITKDEYEAICSDYTALSGLEWTSL